MDQSWAKRTISLVKRSSESNAITLLSRENIDGIVTQSVSTCRMEATTYIDCFPPPAVQPEYCKMCAMTLRWRFGAASQSLESNASALLSSGHVSAIAIWWTYCYIRRLAVWLDCFPPCGVQKWRKTKKAMCWTFGTGSSWDQVQSLYSLQATSVP